LKNITVLSGDVVRRNRRQGEVHTGKPRFGVGCLGGTPIGEKKGKSEKIKGLGGNKKEQITETRNLLKGEEGEQIQSENSSLKKPPIERALIINQKSILLRKKLKAIANARTHKTIYKEAGLLGSLHTLTNTIQYN